MTENIEAKPAQTITKKRERSAAYPAFSLEQVICDVNTLKDKLGKGPYSRDSAARALGYSGVSGASSARVAACVHFGLLERNGGSYELSELSQKMIFSESDGEKKAAVLEALQSPTLYNKLLNEFDGQPLPQMLDNILVRRYGISDSAVATANKVFRESIEYAGVFNNGIISLEKATKDENDIAIDNQQDNMQESHGSQDISIPSPAGNQRTTTYQGNKERSVNEEGNSWSLSVSIHYSLNLSRDLRKEINELISKADDIVDALSELESKEKDVE